MRERKRVREREREYNTLYNFNSLAALATEKQAPFIKLVSKRERAIQLVLVNHSYYTCTCTCIEYPFIVFL